MGALMNNLSIFYDESSDILYASFGKPKKAVCFELDGGELIRLDPFTNKVVGITILDFTDKFKEAKDNIKKQAKFVIPLILDKYEHQKKNK